jgi:DNA-binding transcriptional regulator LsrR (DeoR family)
MLNLAILFLFWYLKSYISEKEKMGRKKNEIQQIKDHAKILFLHENLTQKEIAGRVHISEVSLSRWINEERWESLKVSITITREEQLKNLYRQLSELNKAIAERPEVKYATAVEADTISKLASAINKMESDIGVADIVSVGKSFIGWVRSYDVKKAQEITPLFDLFLKDSLK